MKSIEIVVHAFAEKRPVFAKMLHAQLSWVAIATPSADVQFTICYLPSDAAVLRVIEFFETETAVKIKRLALPPSMLFRRSIGRDLAFRDSRADVVWAADADYIFGAGCLDALAGMELTGLVYPSHYHVHRSHALGDAELARIELGKLFSPDFTIFEPGGCKYAIGGLQIVPGSLARERGYLHGTKWTKPVPNAVDFLDTKEDKQYRAAMGGSTPVELPNLYRMRHSESAFESAEKRLAQTAGKT